MKTHLTALAGLLVISTISFAPEAQACTAAPDCRYFAQEGEWPACLVVPDEFFCDSMYLRNDCTQSVTFWPAGCDEPCDTAITLDSGADLRFLPYDDPAYPAFGTHFDLEFQWELESGERGEFNATAVHDGDLDRYCDEDWWDEDDTGADGDDLGSHNDDPGDKGDDTNTNAAGTESGCSATATFGPPAPQQFLMALAALMWAAGRRRRV